MGSWSIGHWIIVLAVVLLLFGAGKIPTLMSDLAEGIKAFKKGMKNDEEVTPSKHNDQCSLEINKDKNN